MPSPQRTLVVLVLLITRISLRAEGARKKVVHLVFSNHLASYISSPSNFTLRPIWADLITFAPALQLFQGEVRRMSLPACFARAACLLSVNICCVHAQDIGFDGISPLIGTDDNVVNVYFDLYFPKAVGILLFLSF